MHSDCLDTDRLRRLDSEGQILLLLEDVNLLLRVDEAFFDESWLAGIDQLTGV